MQVIKLSDTVQAFPRSVVCCVHGAAPKFLEYGEAKSKLRSGTIFSGHNLVLHVALFSRPRVNHTRLPGFGRLIRASQALCRGCRFATQAMTPY